jgi:hypothetical protein
MFWRIFPTRSIDFPVKILSAMPTKPILLDSRYIAAVICSESSNIGLVIDDFLLQAKAMPTKTILLDSLYIAAVMCSESSNIGLVV